MTRSGATTDPRLRSFGLLPNRHKPQNANALDQAISAQGTTIVDLKAAIEGNDELNADVEAALSDNGDFTMEDVVSISTSADGELTLMVGDVE